MKAMFLLLLGLQFLVLAGAYYYDAPLKVRAKFVLAALFFAFGAWLS